MTANLVLVTLAKMYAVLDLTGRPCPFCAPSTPHVDNCPLALTWSILHDGMRDAARKRARALTVTELDDPSGGGGGWPDIIIG